MTTNKEQAMNTTQPDPVPGGNLQMIPYHGRIPGVTLWLGTAAFRVLSDAQSPRLRDGDVVLFAAGEHIATVLQALPRSKPIAAQLVTMAKRAS